MWEARIQGPLDTPWEGGIFKVRLLFSEFYNELPPKVNFLTIPFHPNVDMQSGRPCWSALDEPADWDPETSIIGLLVSLQHLLTHPNLMDPINLSAADIYEKSPRLYDQLSRDCVVASRRVEAGLSPYPEDTLLDNQGSKDSSKETSLLDNNHQQNVVKPKVKKLSYDDYYSFWKGLATSVPVAVGHMKSDNSLSGKNLNDGSLSNEENQELLDKQRVLWYGNFTKQIKKTHENVKNFKQRVEAMRRAYTIPIDTHTNTDSNTKKAAATASGLETELGTESSSSGIPEVSSGSLLGGAGDVGVVGSNYSHQNPNEEDWEKEALNVEHWASSLPVE